MRLLLKVNVNVAAKFNVVHVPVAKMSNILESNYTKVKEGKAEILFPDANGVFYNPVQEFNRDITIAVISEFVKEQLQKRNIEAEPESSGDKAENKEETNSIHPDKKLNDGVTILEALSASGLRSIRFAKEIAGIKKIVANDFSNEAYESIKRNVAHNNVGDTVQPSFADAVMYMYQHRGKDKEFDVVDIDPYGSASNFLDAAVQSVKNGGLLCVTCTDMAVLAGNFPEAAWSKYQSLPLRTKACHEQALRILLASISAHAARYSRYIEPLLSISIDFYVRVFVRVRYGPSKVKEAAGKLVHLYRCGGCSSFYTQPVVDFRLVGTNKHYHPSVGPPVNKLCEHCKHKHKMGGPFWGAPLHNIDFVRNVLASTKQRSACFGSFERMNGILTMITQELQDVPFHYVTDELSQVIRCGSPPAKVLRSAILNAGYRVSGFHGRINSMKTDATPSVIWDIMRKWAETQKINQSKLKEDSPGYTILHQPITNEKISLDLHPDGELPTQFKGVSRFPKMPPNWGPKARAKISNDGSVSVSNTLKEKSKKYQGKRKKTCETENIDKKSKHS